MRADLRGLELAPDVLLEGIEHQADVEVAVEGHAAAAVVAAAVDPAVVGSLGRGRRGAFGVVSRAGRHRPRLKPGVRGDTDALQLRLSRGRWGGSGAPGDLSTACSGLCGVLQLCPAKSRKGPATAARVRLPQPAVDVRPMPRSDAEVSHALRRRSAPAAAGSHLVPPGAYSDCGLQQLGVRRLRRRPVDVDEQVLVLVVDALQRGPRVDRGWLRRAARPDAPAARRRTSRACPRAPRTSPPGADGGGGGPWRRARSATGWRACRRRARARPARRRVAPARPARGGA